MTRPPDRPATSPSRRVGIGLAIVLLAATAARGQPSLIRRDGLAPSRGPGVYRSDRLRFEYRLIRGRDGQIAAELTRTPEPGSPFGAVRRPNGEATSLEPGDIIVRFDDRPIRGPGDVEAHLRETKVLFISALAGDVEVVWADFPVPTAAGALPAPHPSLAPPESRRVRALIVVDTRTGLPGLDLDRRRIEALLAPLVADGRCDVTVLDGPLATARDVVGWVRGIGDASDDTVFVYYTGHGATDLGRGHVLTFADGPGLLRTSLREELGWLRPRLAVVLTDCCSNLVIIPPLTSDLTAPALPTPAATAAIPRIDRAWVVRGLLLGTKGLVDINASTFDASRGLDEGAGATGAGSLFTAALCRAVSEVTPDSVPGGRDGRITWGDLLPAVRSDLDTAYFVYRLVALVPGSKVDPATLASIRKQPFQDPQAFTLDGPSYVVPRSVPFGLGVTLEAADVVDPEAGGKVRGARVRSVDDRSAILGGSAQVGDVITAVNGRRFQSFPEFAERVDPLAFLNQFRVRRARDGSFVTLPPPPTVGPAPAPAPTPGGVSSTAPAPIPPPAPPVPQ